MAWKRYAFEVKKEGKETFYNALVKRLPIVKSENHFILEVDNEVQIDYITPLLSELVGYVEQLSKITTFKFK